MSGGDVVHVLLAMTLVGLVVGALAGVLEWSHRRERRRWAREAELRQQLRDMEQQIWRESLPAWQREALEAADRQRVVITQEARRRLGLPEEDPAC